MLVEPHMTRFGGDGWPRGRAWGRWSGRTCSVPTRPVSARSAFTMVELLVVIGVVMVVMGLVIPAIGSAVEQARLTADLATVRGNTALIMQYANEHEDVYPVGGALRCAVGRRWYEPLVGTGFLSGIEAADPYSYPRWGHVTFRFSDCLGADPLEFTRGYTRACEESPSTPVAQGLVPFPDRKGLMVKNFERGGLGVEHGVVVDRFFCCVDVWDVPASFCDGSAELGSYLDFSGGERPVIDGNGVGYPIFSSWGGYRATDR